MEECGTGSTVMDGISKLTQGKARGYGPTPLFYCGALVRLRSVNAISAGSIPATTPQKALRR